VYAILTWPGAKSSGERFVVLYRRLEDFMNRKKTTAMVTSETLRDAEAIHAVDFPEESLARIAPAMAAQR
jgi:hypothetical protein